MESLSVIIPTKDREAVLGATLGRLLPAITGFQADIVVVNDSKTSSLRLPESALGRVRVIDNPGAGAASARNLGVRESSGSLLLFLDDDILVDSEHLAAALSFLSSKSNAAMNPDWRYPEELIREMSHGQLGRLLIDSGLTEYRGWVPDLPWTSKVPFSVSKLATFFLLLPRAAYKAVGGFNESFKNQGVEDFEFSRRLERSGIGLFIVPAISVEHNSSDKTTMEAQLRGLRSAGRNRRLGVGLGMPELALPYHPFKAAVYRGMAFCVPALRLILDWVPNFRAFDPVYRFLANRLMAQALFEGYWEGPATTGPYTAS